MSVFFSIFHLNVGLIYNIKINFHINYARHNEHFQKCTNRNKHKRGQQVKTWRSISIQAISIYFANKNYSWNLGKTLLVIFLLGNSNKYFSYTSIFLCSVQIYWACFYFLWNFALYAWQTLFLQNSISQKLCCDKNEDRRKFTTQSLIAFEMWLHFLSSIWTVSSSTD